MKKIGGFALGVVVVAYGIYLIFGLARNFDQVDQNEKIGCSAFVELEEQGAIILTDKTRAKCDLKNDT